MIELSNERIQQILHEETAKKEELNTILRGIYVRYMRLFERYFADIDALDDDKVAELRKYHEETKGLIRHYYMDIPMDICMELREFEDKYSDKLLGLGWHGYLLDSYEDFRENSESGNKNEKCLKADFSKQALDAFYDAMDGIFRDGFGTGSQTASKVVDGLRGLLFGKEE